MNWIGYEAMSIVNHDFKMHLKKLLFRIRNSSYPWLLGKILLNAGTGLLTVELAKGRISPICFDPYKVAERNDKVIGILDLTTQLITVWLDKVSIKKFLFKKLLESALTWSAVL